LASVDAIILSHFDEFSAALEMIVAILWEFTAMRAALDSGVAWRRGYDESRKQERALAKV
jgi:hypothetical protein